MKVSLGTLTDLSKKNKASFYILSMILKKYKPKNTFWFHTWFSPKMYTLPIRFSRSLKILCALTSTFAINTFKTLLLLKSYWISMIIQKLCRLKDFLVIKKDVALCPVYVKVSNNKFFKYYLRLAFENRESKYQWFNIAFWEICM